MSAGTAGDGVIAVIDPAGHTPELDCFNAIAERNQKLPCVFTYHLPALFGMGSLRELERRTDQLSGIVMFGSAASVHDDMPWQRELNSWLLPKLEYLPVLGLCYGHQLLAKLLPGGEVSRVWPDGAKWAGLRRVSLLRDELWGEPSHGPLRHSDAASCIMYG